ncbi:hypothetical protein HDU76_006192, partial [Blyttiomyces sp. JEL0837]
MPIFELRKRFDLLEVIGRTMGIDIVVRINNPSPFFRLLPNPSPFKTKPKLSGGNSTVWKAYDHHLSSFVALKVVLFTKEDHDFQLCHLLQEAAIHRSLHHDNIIKLLDSFYTSTDFAFVLELFDGVDLFEEIETNGPMQEYEVKEVGIQIASALQYLHKRRVIHRDIKPENLMISRTSRNLSSYQRTIKLVDFGLATYAIKPIQTPCGTIGYTAPEIIQLQTTPFCSSGYTFAVDIWAFGCILYA